MRAHSCVHWTAAFSPLQHCAPGLRVSLTHCPHVLLFTGNPFTDHKRARGEAGPVDGNELVPFRVSDGRLLTSSSKE